MKQWWQGLKTWQKVGVVVGALLVLGFIFGEEEAADPEPVAASATTLATTTPTSTTSTTSSTVASTPATTEAVAEEAEEGVPDTLPENLTETLFVLLVRQESEDLPFNWTDAFSDEDIVAFAELICDLWDDGMSFEAIALAGFVSLQDEGWDTDADVQMLGYVIGAGTEAKCPEHSDKVPS